MGKIKNCKSLRLLSEDNYQETRTEIWDILFISGGIMALVSTFQYIRSYRSQRICSLDLNFIYGEQFFPKGFSTDYGRYRSQLTTKKSLEKSSVIFAQNVRKVVYPETDCKIGFS